MRTILLVFLASGCSIVNDPGRHVTGRADGGGTDGGVSVDAGPTPADAGPDGGPTLPFDEVCPTFAEITCGAQTACCGMSTASCVNDYMSLCNMYYGFAVADADVDHDDSAAWGAMARGQALANACSTEIAEFTWSRDGLFAGLVGRITGGATCNVRGSTIAQLFTAAVSCADRNQTCRVLDTEPRCLDRSADGQECYFGLDCLSGRCVGANLLLRLPGRCGAGLAQGERCGLAWECASFVCGGRAPSTCQPATAQSVYCGGG